MRDRGEAPNRYRQIFDEEGIRPVHLAMSHLQEVRRARQRSWVRSRCGRGACRSCRPLDCAVFYPGSADLERSPLEPLERVKNANTISMSFALVTIDTAHDSITNGVPLRSTRLQISRDTTQLLEDSALGLVRQAFRDGGQDVLMTVDETLYHWHWAALLDLRWTSGRKAVVGGQVCAVHRHSAGPKVDNRLDPCSRAQI